MIDFNWTEILTLAILAVILFGPEKLPAFARKAARVVAYLRGIGNDARSQLREELGPEFDDIHLSDLNPRNFVTRHLLSAEDKDDLLSIRDEIKSAGQVAKDGMADVKAGVMSGPDGGEPTAEPQPVVAFDPEAT